MIIFDEIYITGFASIKAMEFDFNQPGLNIIRGENGAGKTTLLSALTWAWFGKMVKGSKNIATWPQNRDKDFNGTMVRSSVYIDGDKYTVVRCLKYKEELEDGAKGKDRLLFFKNGEQYTKHHDKRDLQNHIESILGYSFTLFINTVVFGQKMKRIIEETGPKQKELFDEAFESQFISDAREKTKKQRDDLYHDITTLSLEVDKDKEAYDEAKEDFEDAKGEVEGFEKEREEDIMRVSDKMADLKIKIDETQTRVKTIDQKEKELGDKPERPDLETVNKALNKAQNKYKDLIDKLGTIRSRQKELKGLIKDNSALCPSCGQPINAKQLKKNRKSYKKELADLVVKRTDIGEKAEDAQKAVNTAQKEYDSQKKVYKQYDKKLQAYYSLEGELKELRNDAKSVILMQGELEELKAEKTRIKNRKQTVDLAKLKKRTKNKRTKYRKAKVNLKNQKKELEMLEWLVKEPLGNAGIKAFLFNVMLQNLNEAMLQYSDIVGGIIEFGINQESARKEFYTTITKEGHEIDYNDLSGGQQQLINIIIAFGIHDIISSNKPVNILLMDEVFENLSTTNVEKVADLIARKVDGDTSIFLVTHQTSFESLNANNINVLLVNGFTSIE